MVRSNAASRSAPFRSSARYGPQPATAAVPLLVYEEYRQNGIAPHAQSELTESGHLLLVQDICLVFSSQSLLLRISVRVPCVSASASASAYAPRRCAQTVRCAQRSAEYSASLPFQTMIPGIGEEAFLPKLLAHIHDELYARATSRTGPDRASVIVSGGDGQPNGVFQPALDVSTTGREGGVGQEWRIHPSIFSAILLDRIVGGGGAIIDVDTYGHGSADSGTGGRGRTGRTTKKVQGVARHVQAVGALPRCPPFAPLRSPRQLYKRHDTSYRRSLTPALVST